MSVTPELRQIEQELFSIMRARELSDKSFNRMAMSIFTYQFANNLPYQNYCHARSLSPGKISDWQEIPALSTDAFKLEQHPLTVSATAQAERIFLTSGTTGDIQGRHIFPSLHLYEASVLETWQELNLPKPATVVYLTPKPEQAPQSSLSHMMGVLAKYHEDTETIWAMEADGSINFKKIHTLSQRTEPVTILGTALAFLHLFEKVSITLPAGSFAMETGGYKGTGRQIEKAALYSLFHEKLAIPAHSVINEYSMTELSSQFYTRGLDQPHNGPCWTRTRVIDPRTGTDAASGEPGHLLIYDLANLYSVMALQTQDIAIAGEKGSFTLLGRDPTALPRGCSRAADHALG